MRKYRKPQVLCRGSLANRVLSIFLSFAMVTTCVPATAIAEARDEAAGEEVSSQPVGQSSTEESTPAQATPQVGAAPIAQEQSSTQEKQEASAAQGEPAPTAQPAAPAAEPAAQEQEGAPAQAADARIAIDLGNSSITCFGQTIASPASSITVPAGKDFAFHVTADHDYEITQVSLCVNGTVSALPADANGNYTVPAASAVDGARITISTQRKAGEPESQVEVQAENTATAVTDPVEPNGAEAQKELVAESKSAKLGAMGLIGDLIDALLGSDDADADANVNAAKGPGETKAAGTLSFVKNNDNVRAEMPGNVKSDKNGVVTIPDVTPVAHTTTTSTYNYYFLSWNTKADGTGVAYAPGQTITIDGNTKLYATWVRESTVSFRLNGVAGANPASISALDGETIVLPDPGVTRPGYKFIGWSTSQTAQGSGASNYSAPVYPVGSTYTVLGNKTLYGTWAAEKAVDTTFFVRLDGVIPTEPSGHPMTEYTEGVTLKNNFNFSHFATDSSIGIADLLNALPSDDQIVTMCSHSGITYDPETQYVLWYVVKRESTWHVDGVMLNKALVNLAYDPNCPTGEWAQGTMPDGKQYTQGSTATAAATPTPQRRGYTFTGWNTSAGGDGTAYAPGESFVINQDTTLFAQWRPKDDTEYTIKRIDADTGTVIDVVKDHGRTGAPATVAQEYKTIDNYIYAGDDYPGTVLTGLVAGDGSLVLTIFFHKQFNVTGSIDRGTVTNESQADIAYGGTSEAMTFTPAQGYTITGVTDNGEAVDFELNADGTYTYAAINGVTESHDVEVTTTRDDSQTHSVSAQVEYYFGDTLAEAKAKSEADATDEAVTETGWINDAVTATVEPNQTDKFSGYKWDSTDGETSYELAAGEATDPSTHV
ncbi:Listeria/Bacterioides repeat-containing protein, partial [Parafannyhessea umbonata]